MQFFASILAKIKNLNQIWSKV